MKQTSRQEMYKSFMEFVRNENQLERSLVNRRMFSVFFWCFILPAIVAASVIVLVNYKIMPRSARGQLDWMMLIFPVFYSIYFLSSEVIKEVPKTFRRGGIATSLGQAVKEGEWRERVCEGMKRHLHAAPEDWRWIFKSFSMDLKIMQNRTFYLTALAGAVFFLIMQGIDSLTDTGGNVSFERHPMFGWVETTSNDTKQFAGLALFLTLLYLSGNQTYHALKRYLNCVELLSLEGRELERVDGERKGERKEEK